MFIVARFTTAMIVKQPKCLGSADWINKPYYTQWNTTQLKGKHKQEFAETWMELEGIMLGEVS